MKMNDYQKKARKTAIYPSDMKMIYPALGLAGESGEVCDKIKKVIRDTPTKTREDAVDYYVFEWPFKREEIALELGDVLWYVANLASDLNMTLDYIATKNINKLRDRERRDVIKGEGDNR